MGRLQQKPDQAILNGVGRDLHAAFPPDSPVNPELQKLIRTVDGVYIPDEAADRRVLQLYKRLERLPWGNPQSH